MAITVFPQTADAVTEAVWTQYSDSLSIETDHVVDGYELTDPTGLFVQVEPGTAIIAGYEVVSDAAQSAALTASDVNYVYLETDGSITVNISGTQPADTVYLGTATTDGSGITALSHERTFRTKHSVCVIKSAAQNVTGTTITADTELKASLGEREAWEFEFLVRAYNGTAGNGFKYTIAVASGSVRFAYDNWTSTASINGNGLVASTYTHSGQSTSSTVTMATTGTSGAPSHLRIRGVVFTGDTAGVIVFGFAENSGSDQATVDAGSMLIMRRMLF